MDYTTIDYDHRKARFVIAAPAWLIEHCLSIPTRRWQARDRTWTAPAIRANCDYLKRSQQALQAVFTPAAQDKIDEVMARVAERHLTGNFPTTYQFRTKPFAHQRAGLEALYGKKSMAWFMDMGTGKSKVVIDMHAALCVDHHCDTIVVLCPLSIRNNWVRQLAWHMPQFINYSVHLLNSGDAGVRAYNDWMTNGAFNQRWLIIGIESIASSKTAFDLADLFLCSSLTSACIVDEAHKIKNDSAQRTKTAYRLARRSEWRTIMTGTPIANGPLDLFAMFQFLDPDIIGLGDYYSFRNRYAIMGGYEGREVLGYQHIDELTEIIAPFVYQARKRDVLDLPPKLYEVREVEPTTEQQRLYNTMKKAKMVATGTKQLVVQNVLEKMLRLQEIVGGFVSYENEDDVNAIGQPQKRTYREPIAGTNPKLQEVLTIAQEGDQSTIIWCAFVDEIMLVADALERAKYTVARLYGAYTEDERTAALDAFQSKQARFLVGNAATGGLGLDMTTGTVEVYYSNTFNFVDREQSEDRAHRIGQTKNVTIIDLVMVNTVDTIISKALQAKQDVSEYVRQQIDAQHNDFF
jgi:SNF2 family DNA or RNA helicase